VESGANIVPFVREVVGPGSVLRTDGAAIYRELREEYQHERTVVNTLMPDAVPAHIPLPGVHRVASLLKRWLLGTHQGAVKPAQLEHYLDEFVFRFNRRTSRSRIRTNTLRIAPSREEARTLRVLGERVSRLYNAGNYLCRQAFIAGKPMPSDATLCKRLPVEYEADYRALPSAHYPQISHRKSSRHWRKPGRLSGRYARRIRPARSSTSPACLGIARTGTAPGRSITSPSSRHARMRSQTPFPLPCPPSFEARVGSP
jgi:hypothetical protein